ncbi:MAG: fatty acid desaturase [Myxococcota bacterium]|nr:fatty acid desaturase [Myxococcota bacterium]
MTTADILIDSPPVMAPSEVSEIWLGHLMSLLIPLTTLAFVWTGPHARYVALLFIAPLALYHWIDTRPRHERRQPAETLPAWPFELLVFALVAIHCLILLGLVRLFAVQSFFSLDTLLVLVLVGGNSGFSIITAHELIHRPEPLRRLLGRLLLCTVLYEHFYTEHLRGHHVRVGTPEDPATARFGETYRSFWRRTVPGQFRSAWRLETARLGDEQMSLFDRRQLGNRVLHGLLFGWGLAFAVLYSFGPVAFGVYLIQALAAVRLLEAVNYFEHWGLERQGSRVRPQDSWDTHSWFTYYGLVGLSRHADHHAQPTRPYQQLRVREEAPLLPVGYVALVDMVIVRNGEFIELATEELRARNLGPFRDGSESSAELGAGLGAEPDASSIIERLASVFPVRFRWWAMGLLALLVVSLGGALEAGGGWFGVLVRNLSIAAMIAGVLLVRASIDARVQNGWISWGCGLVLLFIVGVFSLPWIGA